MEYFKYTVEQDYTAIQKIIEAEMTLPDERYRAVLWAEEFLESLVDPKRTPRVPKEIREQARRILRHYPDEWHLAVAADRCPEVFQQEMEDLERFLLKGRESLDGNED